MRRNTRSSCAQGAEGGGGPWSRHGPHHPAPPAIPDMASPHLGQCGWRRTSRSSRAGRPLGTKGCTRVVKGDTRCGRGRNGVPLTSTSPCPPPPQLKHLNGSPRIPQTAIEAGGAAVMVDMSAIDGLVLLPSQKAPSNPKITKNSSAALPRLWPPPRR